MEWTQEFDDGWTATAPFGTNVVQLGDRVVPRAITATRASVDGDRPELTVRLEVVRAVPRCREVTVRAVDGGREVRPGDLRVHVDRLIELLFANFSMVVERQTKGGGVAMAPAATAQEAQKSLSTVRGARKGQTPRTITERLLKRVAEVYLGAEQKPRQAVARAFGVSDRMAAEYIRRCRDHKPAPLIPPTTKGGK